MKDLFHDLFVFMVQVAVFLLGRAFGYFDGLNELKGLIGLTGTPGVTRHKFPTGLFTHDIAAEADDGTGAKLGIDPGLYMVAHKDAAKAGVGRNIAVGLIAPYSHFGEGVFQVGTSGAGAQITKRADDGVADIPIVGFIGMGLDNTVFDLSASGTKRSQAGRSVDFGAHF